MGQVSIWVTTHKRVQSSLVQTSNSKEMKSALYLLPFLVLATLTGCSDFLEEVPTTEVTELDFFQDTENAQLAVNAMYDPLGWGESAAVVGSDGHSYEFIIGDICSDDSEKGSVDSDQQGITQLKYFTAAPGNTNLNMLWGKHYVAIARANYVIDRLTDSPIAEEDKVEFEAEARFIRGYSYFLLVRIFGEVPLFDSPVTPEQLNNKDFTNSTLTDIYAQIDGDFEFAKDNLPIKGVREVGRANAGAAAAYLSRSMMYQIGTNNSSGYTWGNVLDLTDELIAGDFGTYDLVSNYAMLFDTEGENSIESIFEIQSVDTGVDPFSEGPYIGSEWSVFQHPQFMGGWGFNTPSADLANAYEANDPRRPNVALAIGEHAFGIEMENSERNKTGYYTRKAILHPDEWATEKGSGYNIRKFRYADILLMNAEAAYHTGNAGQAVARLEAIRNRASQSTYPRGYFTAEPDAFSDTGFSALDNTLIPGSGPALLEFIYLERRRELAMEHLRFWDLVRTGRFVSTMQDKYGISEGTILSRSLTDGTENPIPVFPIPALEVADWGINQNPGY